MQSSTLVHVLSSGSHLKSYVPVPENAGTWLLHFALLIQPVPPEKGGSQRGSESDFPPTMSFQTWEVRRELVGG